MTGRRGGARTVRRRVASVAMLLAGAFVGLAAPAGAQDLEALAQQRGLALPAAYYEEIRRDPTAYEFSRALFNRTGLRTPAGAPLATPQRTASHGVVTLPVVLALFSDSPQPHITRDMVDASLFVGPAERGTVTDVYLEMSRGALEVRGDAFDWVRTGLTLADAVGTSDGLGSDRRLGEYFLDALAQLDANVDFSQYDNDGPDGLPDSGDDDGYVDVIVFEFLEIAASCGGPAVWPHRWTMVGQTSRPQQPGAPYITNDASAQDSVSTVRVNDYITQGVSDCSGTKVQDAGTIAHEFGHALGLPDYYHPVTSTRPEGRRWVMGCWALMAGGSWGCGRIGESRGPFGPTHMMAHSKYQLGWVSYLDVGEVWNHEVVLDPVQTSGLALRLPMGDAGTEALIIEYRAQQGFDTPLPADGVLMYKLDTSASRRPDPDSGAPYFLTLLEQDGDGALQRTHLEGGDRGVAGDAWGAGGASNKLNAETRPALRLSAGGRTPVVVHEVRVEGGQAKLVLSTGRTPKLIPPPEPFEVMRVRTFREPVRIAGGIGPYTPSGTLPEGFFLSVWGDELLVGGSVVDTGPYELTVSVRDALGNVSNDVSVSLSAPIEWTVTLEGLLQRFLASEAEPLTSGELAHLDTLGNRNGTYDVGDLRRFLREQGAPPGR